MKEVCKYCGNCCWFCFEDTDGWGQCVMQDICDMMHCSDLCTTEEFVSREDKRHYVAVLKQFNRWRRDDHVPSIYTMPDVKDITKAIDFVCEFVKYYEKM